MATFAYKVRTSQGSVITGTLDAPELRQAVSRLKANRFTILEINEKRPGGNFLSSFFKPKVKAKEIVIFSRQLSTMINAGVPIVQGIGIISEQIQAPVFKEIVIHIREDIESGATIADSMGKYPSVFSQLYVNMVRAGELGGVLSEILERLSTYLESAEKLKGKVKGAMVYPAVVLFFALGITVFLLIFVIPTFQTVFASFGADLPLPTKIMIGLSNFMRKYVLLVLGVPIAAVAGLKRFAKTELGRAKFDTLALKLPVFGTLTQKVSVAKFTRTLGTLVRSGVPILSAMETVAKTSGNWVVESAIMNARESIREGEKITDPLSKCPVFPPMVIQMIKVGEETGKLDEMLIKIADFYDEEVDVAVTAMASMIEPVIIVFMGLLVGSIVIAMFLPLFQLADVVGGE